MSDWVRTDLHGHTHFSDGRTTPEEYVRFRAKRRFEVIVLGCGGMAGLDEAISYRLYELAGVPSAKTHYLQLRIVDNATGSTQ